jgi:FkbM family methyltransferase
MDFADLMKPLLRKTRLFPMTKNFYYALGGTVYRSEGEWLKKLFRYHTSVFFVQIGAHDGKSGDSIYPVARKKQWRGILIEPVRYLFERLVENYDGASGIAFENVALAPEKGYRTFYRLKENGDVLPAWYDQIGSLNRNTILSHRHDIPNIEDYLLEELVECVTFSDLVAKHQVTKIDLILIDTEGYDLNILRMIDFRRFRPKLIIYEQKHLSDTEKVVAKRLLQSAGYTVHPMGANNAAVRRWGPFSLALGVQPS